MDLNLGPDYLKTLRIIGKEKEAENDLNLGKMFLLNLKRNDNVLNYGHNDADGLCSVAQIDQHLDERGISHSNSLTKVQHRTNYSTEVIRRLRKNLCDKLIISDLEMKQFEKGFEFCEKNNIQSLIIDHHEFIKNKISGPCTYVNLKYPPLRESPAASAIVYKLCKEAGSKKDLLWVALLGSASDKMIADSIDMINPPELLLNTYARGKQLDPDFNPVVYALNVSYYDEELNRELFGHLKQSIKLDDPLYIWTEKDHKTKRVFDVIDESERELRFWLKKGKVTEDKKAKLYYLETKSKKDIKRLTVGVLSIRKPGYTVATSKEEKGLTYFSFRSQVCNLLTLFEKAKDDLPYQSHGGHAQAAGLILETKYKNKFLDNIIRELSK